VYSLPLNVFAHTVSFTAQAFVSGLWQGAVLIAAVVLAMRILPRLGPSARFVVWAVTFGLAATLPLLHAHPAVSRSQAALHVSPWVAVGVTGLWATLAIFRLAQLASQAICLRRIWSRAVPVEVSDETRALLATAERRAELCASSDVDAPSVIGFFAPRLLIPAALLPELTEGELRQIVLHECEHLRRRDDWINLAQKLALALFPLNFALLWADRRLGLERELACDAGVVARLSSPFDYAHCLTRLAEHRLRSRRVALALSAWSRRSELAQRVQLLLKPMGQLSPLQRRASLVVLSVGLVTGSIEMARVPRLIAFTDIAPVAMAANAMSPMPQVVPATYMPAYPAHAELTVTRPVRRVRAVHVSASTTADAVPRVAEQPAVEAVAATASSPSIMQTDVRGNGNAHAVLASAHPHNARSRAQLSHATVDDSQDDVYLLNDATARARYAAVRFGDGWLIIQL
jgi:beta-lactamase regulating signal transducer with metallopeptidase domain